MSLDLFQRETAERVSTMPLVRETEPGVFDNFWRGAGLFTMRGLARAGRSIDVLGSVGPIIQDAFTGGTVAQDQYFKEHDEVFGSAVDYWTPRPGEVGVAGEVAGQLASMLPLIFASPSFAVGEMQLGTAEDLIRKGVSAGRAQAVGATQAAGLGLGIWVPILGRNLWERMVIGGAGFNVVQGVTTRAASSAILEGMPQAEEFRAFDGTALTIDVLLGLAFGGWAHLNPEMRSQGKRAWERIGEWAQTLTPSDVAALATLRQAQHLNVDSTPGKPASPQDVEAHVQRTKRAIEQVVRGQPVDVEDLPAGQYKQDPARLREMRQRAEELVAEGERVRVAEDLPPPPEPDIASVRAAGNLEALDPADQARTIGQTIRQQLEITGMPTEEAQANSALWEAFFRTAGERYGVAPAELMKQYGVNVQALRGEAKLLGALDQAAMSKADRTFYQAVAKGKGPREVFYSELERQVEGAKMNQAPAKGWKDLLKNFAQRGVKAEELKWSGIEEWLDLQQGKVTKEQVLAFLKDNGVKVSEVKLGAVGEKTLGDRMIAGKVDELSDLGFDTEVDPAAGVANMPGEIANIGFNDRETGDIITADEIRRYATEADQEASPEVKQRMQRAAELARDIESYWYAPAKSRADLEADLRRAGWGWEVIDDDFLIYRYPKRQGDPSYSVTDGTVEASADIPDNVVDLAENLEAIVMQGAEAEQGRPTKFGTYQLPGGKNYRELLLTLPHDAEKLPKGYRIEKSNPAAAEAKLEKLTQEWQQWLRDNGYEQISADDWLANARRSQMGLDEWPNKREQVDYVTGFLSSWDRTQDEISRGRYTLVRPDGSGNLLRDATSDKEAFDQAMRMLDREGKLDEGTFRESHWDEPNVLAHVRYNDRTDVDGKRVLFIEEIQSDWAQKGKKRGFMAPPKPPQPLPTDLPEGSVVRRSQTPEEAHRDDSAAYIAQDESDANTYRQELIDQGVKPEDILIAPGNRISSDQWNVYVASYAVFDPQGNALENRGPSSSYFTPEGARKATLDTLRDNVARANRQETEKGKIPAGPFVGKTESWVGLVMKRMIREAAERGFDRIAWTTGEQQTQRYTSALRKAVDEIEWHKTEKGVQIIGYKGRSQPADNDQLVQARRRATAAEIVLNNAREAFLQQVGPTPRDALGGAPERIVADDQWTPQQQARLQDNGIELNPGEVALVYRRGWILQKADRTYDVQIVQDERAFPAGPEGLAQAERWLWDEWVSSEYRSDFPQSTASERLDMAERRRADARDELSRLERGRTGNRQKVVDTTEKEDVLSDAIGKAMAERIIQDPNQSGVISGEGIVVADTGMAQFYDRIVPNVAKDILKKMGGGQVGTTKIEIEDIVNKRAPTIGPASDEVPNPNPMDPSMRDSFQGAENFPNGGEAPLYGETTLEINGQKVEMMVIVDHRGVNFQSMEDGALGDLALFADANDMGGNWSRWDLAKQAFLRAWNNQELFDGRLQVINGDLPGTGKRQSPQLAFDITPEMKQKVLAGQPLFQSGARGQIKFGEGETIIGLLEKADRSTFLHETGHFFLQVTRDLAGRKDTPEEAKQDWAVIQDWLGLKGQAEIPVEAHEKFARGFEAYLMTGRAPSTGLQAAFERFRDWLIGIYESITALEVEVAPDIMAVFDRMLALREIPAQPGVPRPAIEDTPAARRIVDEYRERLEAGEGLEPVLVDRTNPARVVDGNHRLQAHLEAGVPADIVAVPATEAIVKMGTENWTPTRVAQELGQREAEAPAAKPGGTEPPPPRGSRGAEAAGAEAIEARVEQLGIENAQIRSLLEHMAEKESGWEQMGGRLDMGRLVQRNRLEQGGMGGPREKDLHRLGVPAFTTWIPKAEWWTGRPDKKMNERKVKDAVKKALAGEPLRAAEKRTVDYMLYIANQRIAVEKQIGPAEVSEILQDMALERELEPTTQNIVDVDLVAQARELDEAGVERAAIQYENDDQGFMAQVRRILDQASANRRAAGGRQEGGAEAPDAGGRVPGEEEGGAREIGEAGQGEGEGPDAVTREAERFVLENPDRLITVGTDPAGQPMQMTAREYLETARAEASQARDDAALFEVAAQCLLGGGRA